MARVARILLTLLVAPGLSALALTVPASPAQAHEERPAGFPDETGKRPKFLGYDNARHRVVCRPNSAKRIKAMPPGRAKQRSRRMLDECRFGSIQTAIDSIKRRRTSIYVLPGTYHEKKYARDKRSYYCSHLETESKDALLSAEYIGSLSSPDTGAQEGTNGESNPIALSYADQRRCPHNLNLIAVFGDRTPRNDSISCDSKFCGTQIVGTGRRSLDVIIDNRFSKLNGIRIDRGGGAYVRNLTVQQSEFNAIYVLETDGFVIDRVLTRGNDEYGILAFASDHGLIQNSEAYFNGDSGIYPGSGADLNADNPNFEVTRYAIEIRNNSSHDNALGYSGTAGNSIWAHHNDFYDNATGIATDSLFPGHPGLPQDHARWNHNRVFSNNSNYYTEFVDTGICAKPMAERGYLDGTVCPVIPVPVGTGVLIAGGNFNSTDHNWIYDNWRYGTMQLWVPAALRDDYDPRHMYDTSNHNRTFKNKFGISPSGRERPNGMDHWWDDQGNGNCWEDNEYAGGKRTDNFTFPVPSCADGGSVFTPGAFVKDAGFLSCVEYDRNDPDWRHPPGCSWFDSPSRPGPRAAAAAPVSAPTSAPATSGMALAATPLATAVTGLLLLAGLRRRQRAA
ncbi:right-handed parallel beta-helix repeat-containing protein [Nocardioides sp.]|uniref:right-handed parallel beta-helix repeat-containing protein n=1 Tax=Nocardioides sp. TaxID=35761 RepID=UPI0035648B0D